MPTTFVYVSHAEDADISTHRLTDRGELQPGPRAKAGPNVAPMVISPDRRFLYAAIRSQPYRAATYAIDRGNGALTLVGTSPLHETVPFITVDKTGRYLLTASYSANLMTVNAIGVDGLVVAPPRQIIPVGRNAHSIRIDDTNRFVYVPCLGSDMVFQLTFDAASGRVASSTPAVARTAPGFGPRHFVFSADNKFLYLVSELLASVTSFAIDPQTGSLTEIATTPGLPATSTLKPGAPRLPTGTAGSGPARDTSNDIWAADIHLTPDGKFLYISERTHSTLNAFKVDSATGKLSFIDTFPTEKQPRSFAIDPTSRYLIATGEKSDTISVHRIDPSTGALKLLGKYPGGKGSGWVEVVSFE